MELQNNKIAQSIIKTLCYSDIFEYPLTSSEILKYYLGTKVSKKEFKKRLDSLVLKNLIEKKGKFYFLIGRSKICLTRKNREKESATKWLRAKRFAKILSRIPSIKMIGVSGSLSMNNADLRDDIDLFFITSENLLWISRFMVNLVLIAYAVKRKTSDSFGIDRICPNMFITPNYKIDRNLFSAHEVAQLKVLINKNQTYEKFIASNAWIKKYMPNAIGVDLKPFASSNSSNKILSFLDWPFYSFQLLYMKKKVTTEKISQDAVLFHPKNKTNFVKILHRKKYQNYIKFAKLKVSKTTQNRPILASVNTPGY